MSERERIPSCQTCGKPLPCVLHDRKTREGILASEFDHPPLFEKTKEWMTPLVVKDIIPFEGGFVVRTGNQIVQYNETQELPVFELPVHQQVYGVTRLPDGRLIVWTDVFAGVTVLDTKTSRMDGIDGLRGPGEHNLSGVGVAVISQTRAVVGRHIITGKGRDKYLMNLVDITKPKVATVFQKPVDWKGTGMLDHLVPMDNSRVFVSASDAVARIFDAEKNTLVTVGKMEIGTRAKAILPISKQEVLVLSCAVNQNLWRFDFSSSPPKLESVPCDFAPVHMVPFASKTALVADAEGRLGILDYAKSTVSVEIIAETGLQIQSIARVSDMVVMVGGPKGEIQRWELSKEKLRKYHIRKTAAPEEELPELPEV